MTMLRAFITIFIVSIFVRDVRAEEFGCKLLSSGHPFVIVRNGEGNEITYTVSIGNSNWALGLLGDHATAVIESLHREPGRFVRGLVWLAVLNEPPHQLAEAVSKSVLEGRSPMWLFAPYQSAKTKGEERAARFGSFVGWRRDFETYQKDGRASHDIVAVSADDGCGLINLWLETSPQDADRSIADSVEDLLTAIKITKSGG
jgi:hypothetical protein